MNLIWSLNCRKCITLPECAQGGFEKKLKKVFGGGEAQPLRAAHGAPPTGREPARGRENVANVGMLPVPILPISSWELKLAHAGVWRGEGES